MRRACDGEQVLCPVQCAELAEKLAEDVTGEGLKGRTITLKLKTTNFEVRTRAATLSRHISASEDILREALRLLRAELPITIRLMVSHLLLVIVVFMQNGQSGPFSPPCTTFACKLHIALGEDKCMQHLMYLGKL